MPLLFLQKDSLAIYKIQYEQNQLQREKKDVRLMHHTTQKLDKNLEI